MTDPRYIDPRLNDPALRSDESIGGMWTWIAGLAVLALMAFVIIAAWNNSNTASYNPARVSTNNAPIRNVIPPPSGTGSGSSALRPLAPAPAKNGMQ